MLSPPIPERVTKYPNRLQRTGKYPRNPLGFPVVHDGCSLAPARTSPRSLRHDARSRWLRRRASEQRGSASSRPSPTLHLANELHASRHHLLDHRHHVQDLGLECLSPSWFDDAIVETEQRTPARRAIRTATLTIPSAAAPTNSMTTATMTRTVRSFSASSGDLLPRSTCKRLIAVARDDDGDGVREVHTNTIEGQ